MSMVLPQCGRGTTILIFLALKFISKNFQCLVEEGRAVRAVNIAKEEWAATPVGAARPAGVKWREK